MNVGQLVLGPVFFEANYLRVSCLLGELSVIHTKLGPGLTQSPVNLAGYFCFYFSKVWDRSVIVNYVENIKNRGILKFGVSWLKLYFGYFIHTIQENYIQFIQDLTISRRLVLTSFRGILNFSYSLEIIDYHFELS